MAGHEKSKEAQHRADNTRLIQEKIARKDHPEIWAKCVEIHRADHHGPHFSETLWLRAGGTQEQIEVIKAYAIAELERAGEEGAMSKTDSEATTAALLNKAQCFLRELVQKSAGLCTIGGCPLPPEGKGACKFHREANRRRGVNQATGSSEPTDVAGTADYEAEKVAYAATDESKLSIAMYTKVHDEWMSWASEALVHLDYKVWVQEIKARVKDLSRTPFKPPTPIGVIFDTLEDAGRRIRRAARQDGTLELGVSGGVTEGPSRKVPTPPGGPGGSRKHRQQAKDVVVVDSHGMLMNVHKQECGHTNLDDEKVFTDNVDGTVRVIDRIDNVARHVIEGESFRTFGAGRSKPDVESEGIGELLIKVKMVRRARDGEWTPVLLTDGPLSYAANVTCDEHGIKVMVKHVPELSVAAAA